MERRHLLPTRFYALVPRLTATSGIVALAVLLTIVLLTGCAGTAPTTPDSTDANPGAGGATGTQNPGATYSYRYGAKFEPPIGRVVHGAGQWVAYNAKYAALLPPSDQPASELLFISLADTVRPWNPALLASALANIDARGRIPLPDITLRGNKPSDDELAALPDPYYAADAEIATTTKWDSRIDDLAKLFKDFKKPILLRIGGEFSGIWNGYHPWVYPLAYRKIVARIRAAGADNVAFVWCYEPAASADFDEQNGAGAFKWYPGDDVVDWFSIDLFATADVSGPTGAHGSLTQYGRTIKFLDMAVAKQRPVVIAESSPSKFDFGAGSSAWDAWFAPYFAVIAARPEIEWFVYINYDWTQAGEYLLNGWKNNDLAVNPPLAALYAAEIAKSKYLHSAERATLKDYGKYK